MGHMISALLLALLLSIAHARLVLTPLARTWDEYMDKNGDGVLQFAELDQYVLAHAEEPYTDLKWVAEFNRFLDANKDGEITRDEFIAWSPHGDLFDSTTPQQIHLAMTNDDTEMVVMWVTDDNIPSVVRYGTSSGNYTTTITGESWTYDVGILGGWHKWIHYVLLTGLQPGDFEYYYQCGDPNSTWSSEFKFHTAPTAPRPTRVAFVADQGTYIPLGFAVIKQEADDDASLPYDFVLHGGDIAYGGTGAVIEDETIWDMWAELVQVMSAHMPYMVAVGNHEHYYNWTSFRSRFRMPGFFPDGYGGNESFWFSFDYGCVHYVCISSEDDYSVGSPQYDWLVTDLAAANARRQTNGGWIILSRHRPTYNSEKSETQNGDPVLEPVLLKYNVDLVLEGHMHSYQRTYPVYEDNPYIYPTNFTFTDPPAPVYVVQGTSGAFCDSLDRDFLPYPAWAAHRDDRFGYGRMTVFNTTHLYYEYISLHDAAVVDEMWIIKNATATPVTWG